MKLDKHKFFQGMILGIVLILIIITQDFLKGQNNTIQSNSIPIANIDSVYNLPMLIASSSSIIKLSPTPQEKKSEENFGYCLNVPVLLYHHVRPNSDAKSLGQTALNVDNVIFEQQMSYLVSQGYVAISAKQLIDALLLHSTLPQKSIAITFDDGYKDMYTYVYPILQKYRLIANLMIATGLVGGSDYLSWQEIEEMSRSGLIYFVDHTWSHYALGNASHDKIKFEIETAKQQLEQHTGQTINIFAYPFGSFSNEAIKVLQEDGFLGAFSTIPGFWQCDSFILALHRNHIGNAPLSAYGL